MQASAAVILALQKLIFDVNGAEANDLDDGDAGCGGERVVRQLAVSYSKRQKKSEITFLA